MTSRRPPRVFIRTDASSQIGSGHVMRCLTLAGALRQMGADVAFISRELPGHLCDTIATQGYEVYRLPAPAVPVSGWLGVPVDVDRVQTQAILSREGGIEWLVVDHYGLDKDWESALRPWVRRILVIDDLANRSHACDVLLDQNLCAGMQTRYEGLVPVECRKLLGPHYALLRPEFHRARKGLPVKNGDVRRLLIFFGGVDLTNETEKALEALARLHHPALEVAVVAGASNPHLASLRARVATLPRATLHVAVQNMAELMARADLSIGAGGTSTWERCYLGLPTLILTLAENQVPLVEAVSAAGAAWHLGASESVGVDSLAREIQRVVASPDEIAEVSRRALALMEMNGRAPGAAELMMEATRVDA